MVCTPIVGRFERGSTDRVQRARACSGVALAHLSDLNFTIIRCFFV